MSASSPAAESLGKACEEGNYYAALLQFKSVLSRKISGRTKSSSTALRLLCEGISACASSGDRGAAAAADLAAQLDLLLESFSMAYDDTSIDFMRCVSDAFLNGRSPDDRAVASAAPDLHSVHKLFLHRCFTWSRDKRTQRGEVTPVPGEFLHARLALLYLGESDAEARTSEPLWKAYKHLINTRSAVAAGHLATAVAALAHKAPSAERDLFIARTFLQLLCRTRPYSNESVIDGRAAALRTASAFWSSVHGIADLEVDPELPLLRFGINLAVLLELGVSSANATSAPTQPQPQPAAAAAAAEGASGAPLCSHTVQAAVDALLDVYLPVLQRTDPRLEELAVVVVQQHKATVKHSKKPSAIAGLLGALMASAS